MKDGYYVEKDVKGHLTSDYRIRKFLQNGCLLSYMKISSTYKEEVHHMCLPAINLTIKDQSHDILRDFLVQVEDMKGKLEDEIYRYILRYFVIYQTAIQNKAGLEGLEAMEKLVEK